MTPWCVCTNPSWRDGESHRDMTPSSHARWKPLLEGELRCRAMQAVTDIADMLADVNHGGGSESDLALFFSYAARAREAEGAHFLAGISPRKMARVFLARALDRAREVELEAGLHSGMAGLGWVAAHLSSPGFDLAFKYDIHTEIEPLLSDYVSEAPWPGTCDLISGLVGIGVYALERLPGSGARKLLQGIVRQLSTKAIPMSREIAWHTPPGLLTAHQRRETPSGRYDLGVAHGTPGIIAFLGQAFFSGVSRATARRLADSAMEWLSAQVLETDKGRTIPYMTAPEIKPQPARLAWCYGDLGVAASLVEVSRRSRRPAWHRFAIDLALGCTLREWPESGVRDACLCHGAAGNGHAFNRLYHNTRDSRFRDASRLWFEHALNMRLADEGIAGFRFWSAAQHPPQWVAARGLLEGAAGIGLALLAAATPVEPRWDRLLLLS